ncbi:MAG: flagellar basal body rod protein FlgB, partial [Alphaproteobacteria bacterium]|nr:flagellar basal body rod protein FlgB [Alphaproteobacteria bacterium]
LLTPAKQRMDWLAQRQQVLAQNIANSDSPAYHAQDLKPQDFKSILQASSTPASAQVKATMTNPAHMAGTIPDKGNYRAEAPLRYEASPTGNTVVVEDEMGKVADTDNQYGLVTNLFQKQLQIIRLALGKSSG